MATALASKRWNVDGGLRRGWEADENDDRAEHAHREEKDSAG
jgi:hypothetical protein